MTATVAEEESTVTEAMKKKELAQGKNISLGGKGDLFLLLKEFLTVANFFLLEEEEE